jgi:hypothetical protein
VLQPIVIFGARVACALLGAAVLAALAGAAGTVLGPEIAAWLRVHGWAFALAGAAGGVLLARAGWPPGRLLTAPPPRLFAALAFAVALGSGVWAHLAVHKGVPDVPDELSYLHQARGFADGVLAPPSPPLAEHHYVSWGIHDRGLWYSVFPPGYGVLLAVGVEAGAPFLVNPLLGALLALALFALGRDLFGDGVAARAAVLVYLASWFRLLHAGSFMSHPTAALLTVLAVLGAWRGVLRGRSAGWALAAGASLGALAATRPLNAIAVAAALAPALLAGGVRWRNVAAGLAGLVPVLLAYGAYNHALTGSATLPPQQRYMQLKEERGDCFRLGFGPGVGQCPITQSTNYGKDGFQPRHAWQNTRRRADAYLAFGFGFAPLAVLVAAGALGGVARAPRRRALLAGLVLAPGVAYALFFYHGVAYGPRFYYETFAFAALLSGLALADLDRLLGGPARAALAGLVVALLATGLVAARPAVEKHAGQRNHTRAGAVLEALARPELRDAVVFVDSMVVPAAATPHPARLAENRPLVVKDLGDAANAGYMRLWPDRRPVRLAGTRTTPLAYAKDAPVRHEGGALYPLEASANGFGDRVPPAGAFNLPLSNADALRFVARAAPAWLELPSFAPAQARAVRVAFVAHPRGPEARVVVDGQPISDWIPTRADPPEVRTIDLPAAIAPGRHRVQVHLRAPGVLLIDYVEMREDGGP